MQRQLFDVHTLEFGPPQEKVDQWYKQLNKEIEAIESAEFQCWHKKNSSSPVSHLEQGEIQQILESCEANEQYALHILRRFLLAASAKDCSVMMTFCKVSAEYAEKHTFNDASEGVLSVDCTGTIEHYQYRIGVVDVDPKPVSKITHYYQLDAAIVSHYSMSALKQKQD